jgi:hypothetical protein
LPVLPPRVETTAVTGTPTSTTASATLPA